MLPFQCVDLGSLIVDRLLGHSEQLLCLVATGGPSGGYLVLVVELLLQEADRSLGVFVFLA